MRLAAHHELIGRPTVGVQPPQAGLSPRATAPPGRHPGRRPRPVGSAATIVRRPTRRRPRAELAPRATARRASPHGPASRGDSKPRWLPTPNSPAAGWDKTMFAQEVCACQTRQGRGRWPANGWSSAVPGGSVADGHLPSGTPPWPSASVLGVGCNDSSPAPPACGHGPGPGHDGHRRRTHRRPSGVRRCSRKESPFVKRGEGEGDGRPTTPSSAAATEASEASEGAVGWSEWLGRFTTITLQSSVI
jgi:hypothetical protein